MVERSAEAWRLLFAEQESSGLTAARSAASESCARSISACERSNWAGRGRKREAPTCVPSAFVRIERVPKEKVVGPRALMRLGGCEWAFEDVSPRWLAELMKALA